MHPTGVLLGESSNLCLLSNFLFSASALGRIFWALFDSLQCEEQLLAEPSQEHLAAGQSDRSPVPRIRVPPSNQGIKGHRWQKLVAFFRDLHGPSFCCQVPAPKSSYQGLVFTQITSG